MPWQRPKLSAKLGKLRQQYATESSPAKREKIKKKMEKLRRHAAGR